jgi:CelD/BcsL family acetyltransferase involved in cellulose biosynthesis
LEHYGDEVTPLVAIVRDESGEVGGLLPLAVARRGRPRVARIAGANLGDAFRPLAERGKELEIARAIGGTLVAGSPPWSLLYLDNVEADAWAEELLGGPGRGLRHLRFGASALASIETSEFDSWEAYLAARSSNLRGQIRRHGRRLREQGFITRRTTSADQVEADFQSLFRLHDLRWRGRGGSTLGSPRARSFHADFAAAALSRGWLRLWFLERGDEAIAAWYGWYLGGSYAFYNGGFDPSWSRYGPGVAILSRAIEAAFEEGAEHFEFLLGEESYKARFATRSREVCSIVVARTGPAALLARAELGIRRLGRRLPSGSRAGVRRWIARRLPGARRR